VRNIEHDRADREDGVGVLCAVEPEKKEEKDIKIKKEEVGNKKKAIDFVYEQLPSRFTRF